MDDLQNIKEGDTKELLLRAKHVMSKSWLLALELD